jgi:hypothetical protein
VSTGDEWISVSGDIAQAREKAADAAMAKHQETSQLPLVA